MWRFFCLSNEFRTLIIISSHCFIIDTQVALCIILYAYLAFLSSDFPVAALAPPQSGPTPTRRDVRYAHDDRLLLSPRAAGTVCYCFCCSRCCCCCCCRCCDSTDRPRGVHVRRRGLGVSVLGACLLPSRARTAAATASAPTTEDRLSVASTAASREAGAAATAAASW